MLQPSPVPCSGRNRPTWWQAAWSCVQLLVITLTTSACAAAFASHLFWTEPSNLVVSRLVHAGTLQRICAPMSKVPEAELYKPGGHLTAVSCLQWRCC